MDVAGGYDWLAELFTELHYTHVELAQTLVVGDPSLAYQEFVVGYRLYFEIVVDGGDFFNVLLALSVENSAEKLAGFAGAADYKTLAVLLQLGQGHAGFSVEVIKVGVGNQLVEIFQTDLILRQDYHVISVELLDVNIAKYGIEVAEFLERVSLAGNIYEGNEYFGQHFRVVDRAMVVEITELEFLCNCVQLEVLEMRERRSCKLERVGVAYIVGQTLARACDLDKRRIEIRIMRDENSLARKRDELFERFLFRWGVLYHLIGYACKLRDVGGDRALRIYKCLEAVDYLHVIELDRADFGYSVEVAAESGGLNIEYDHVAVYRAFVAAGNQGIRIVDKIRFHAVDYLEFAAVLAYFLDGVHCLRKRLNVTVIRNCDSLMPPRKRLLDQLAGGSYCVHVRHGCMEVQLNALVLCLVLALPGLYRSDGVGTDIKTFCKCIKLELAGDYYRLARLNVALDNVCILYRSDYFKYLGGGLI